MITLKILLIEDHEETLSDLLETLPRTLDSNYYLDWEGCQDFKEAIRLTNRHRYDLIVTDIYVDAKGHKQTLSLNETGAGVTINNIRNIRFCPILAITDGSRPVDFPDSPFIVFADKTKNEEIVSGIQHLIGTNVPRLAKILHDELDKESAWYLWHFLEKNWAKIESQNSNVLERLIRRRASVHFGRLSTSESPTELETVEGLEFYIYPSISTDTLRLGEIVQHKITKQFSVILTPHCYLNIQPNDADPRADFILTLKAISIEEVFSKYPFKSKGKTDKELLDSIRKRIQGPAGFGQPSGRYWFMPSFLDIPELYCDFMQISSIEYTSIISDKSQYARIAVLDTPFAESLQTSFTKFYSAVGTPNLDPTRFKHFVSS